MATQHTHGRGGAGNFHTDGKEAVNANELETPTIKQTMYTTGRGGSGNMASNDSAENARKAQDVVAPEAHEKSNKGGTFHWGRGGEGNKTTLDKHGAEEHVTEKKDRRKSSGAAGGQRRPSLIEKGKEKLGLDGHKKAEGSAIED